MAEADHKENTWKQQEEKSDQLRASVAKLRSRGEAHAKQKYGFSTDFLDQVQTTERAMELCGKAMEVLATEYIESLSRFKEAENPLEALAALEKGETLWQGEANIIRYFDKEGGEKQFLNSIREQTYTITQDRLEQVANQCSKHPTNENVALCLAILGVMDTILGELGRSEGSSERQRLRDIAKAFC